MPLKRRIYWLSIVLLFLLAISIIGCSSGEAENALPGGIRTRLLVEAPTEPISAGSSITVRSRTESVKPGVSHVELYAVQLPSGQENVLIRSDAAPFNQTVFSAMQVFTPLEPGPYVIKVVGYNKLGQPSESEYISFDVE